MICVSFDSCSDLLDSVENILQNPFGVAFFIVIDIDDEPLLHLTVIKMLCLDEKKYLNGKILHHVLYDIGRRNNTCAKYKSYWNMKPTGKLMGKLASWMLLDNHKLWVLVELLWAQGLKPAVRLVVDTFEHGWHHKKWPLQFDWVFCDWKSKEEIYFKTSRWTTHFCKKISELFNTVHWKSFWRYKSSTIVTFVAFVLVPILSLTTIFKTLYSTQQCGELCEMHVTYTVCMHTSFE